MQPKSQPADSSTGVDARKPLEPRLSVVHAEALYRPVPPVGLDDDGFVFEDGRVSEAAREAAEKRIAELEERLRRSEGL